MQSKLQNGLYLNRFSYIQLCYNRYCIRFGFQNWCYQGLETGERNVVKHVIKQNDIVFEFQSPLQPNNEEMGQFLKIHGDAVKDKVSQNRKKRDLS